ncbi:hypothetical protein ACFYRL_36275 [Streptomyces goshikiensis]|uniref:hypothetical protein n=1 Tax=Streptomyces goshikiensis TaxID=1942 RepID=UPI0036BCC421
MTSTPGLFDESVKGPVEILLAYALPLGCRVIPLAFERWTELDRGDEERAGL